MHSEAQRAETYVDQGQAGLDSVPNKASRPKLEVVEGKPVIVDMDSLETLSLEELQEVHSIFLNSYFKLSDGRRDKTPTPETNAVSETVQEDVAEVIMASRSYDAMQEGGAKTKDLAFVAKRNYRAVRIRAIKNLDDAVKAYEKLPHGPAYNKVGLLALPKLLESNVSPSPIKKSAESLQIKQSERTRRLIGWLGSLRYTEPTDTDIAFFVNGCPDLSLSMVNRNGEHYNRLTLHGLRMRKNQRPLAESVVLGSNLGISDSATQHTVLESTKPLTKGDLIKTAHLNHLLRSTELFDAHIDIKAALAKKLTDKQLLVLNNLGPTNEITSIASQLDYTDSDLLTKGIIKKLNLGNRDRLMILAAESMDSKLFSKKAINTLYNREITRHGGKVSKSQILNSILETVLDLSDPC